MNLWRKGESSRSQRAIRLKHDVVIGPQRHSDLFGRPARLYYCVRCKWRFLVCASTVAILDEDERPLAGEESLRRFNTFAQGPCPVLEAFVAAALADVGALRPSFRGQPGRPGNPAPNHNSARPAFRPSLRVLTRLREM
jgi:hypothetical protein